MSVWDTYKARMEVTGVTKRERTLKHTKSYLSSKLSDSLSCHEVLINGLGQKVAIINQKEDISIKKICALPGETLAHGGLVDFAKSKWLITELDANDEVYAFGKMHRCNYLLKWLNKNGDIIEKWCVVEDGTKYLIGERTEDMMAIGDARIAITICKDNDTIELTRGRRFLVDDLESHSLLAYQITKPNTLYNIYNGNGVFRFILNEVNSTDDDNFELRIADYYNWTPDKYADTDHANSNHPVQDVDDKNEGEVWI